MRLYLTMLFRNFITSAQSDENVSGEGWPYDNNIYTKYYTMWALCDFVEGFSMCAHS